MTLLQIVLATLFFGASWSKQIGSDGRCYSPNDVVTGCAETSSNAAHLDIYVDLPLTCSGHVEGHHFQPINFGTVFVGIFRPLYNTSDDWKMIGFNKIVVDESFVLHNFWYTIEIPYEQQLLAEAGDVLGMFTYANATNEVIGHISGGENKMIITSDTYETLDINGVYTTKDAEVHHRGRFGLNAVIKQSIRGFCESPILPIQQLKRDSAGHLNIFVELQFHCEGYINDIDFYASNVGKFYLSTWRPVIGEEQKWTLIGSIAIEATSVGAHFNHTIPRNQQIYVQESDVIGIFYDQGAVGVVPYENYHKSTLDIEHTSKVHVSQTPSEDLQEGTVMTGLLNDGRNRRIPALNTRIVEREQVQSATTPATSQTTTTGTTSGASSEIAATEYEGCFLDDIHDRDFIESTLWLEPQTMTVEACADYCIALDHPYMGLQDGEGCRCGDSYRDTNPADGCNKPCPGLPSTTCGGYSHNAVYHIKAAKTEYQGCFLDDIHDRDFIESTLWLKPQTMTVEACAGYCIALDHPYMRLQDGKGCRCGISYRDTNPADGCNKPCPGLPSTTCGGYSHNAVYHISEHQ